MLSGRLRKAVRGLTNRDGGGVLQPDDACTKTGRRVLDVLHEKHPAMRGIGEIFRRLIAKCVLSGVGHQAMEACGNLNFCAGLPAGIEGAVHAMTTAWGKSDGRAYGGCRPAV